MAARKLRSSQKLPSDHGFTYEYNSNQSYQYPEYSSASNAPPDLNNALGYYDNGGYNDGTSHQPLLQYTPGDNGALAFDPTPSAGDPSLFGIGSNFGGDDPGSLLSPIQEFEPPVVASSPHGYECPPGYEPVFRSRGAYRNLLGIPDSHEQAGYEQHSLDSSVYQGSSSNLGFGGGRGMQDMDYLTTLSHTTDPVPSSGGGSKTRRPRKPPELKKKYECNRSDCSWSFDQPKGLKRHRETKHADENTAMYTCKCNHRTPIKSNYRRHLNSRASSCGGRNDFWPSFMCKCGSADFSGLDEHLQHLDACDAVNERLGRPRKIRQQFDD